MRRIVLCLGILLAWPLTGQAAKPTEPTSIDFDAGAWVDVDATGKAHVVEMDTLREFKDDGKPGSIADIIKARLRERIDSWEFQPPMRDGVAVPGKTHINAYLEASSSDDGGMSIRILNVSTGAKLVNRQMGGLTVAMMDYGYVGRVTVDVAWKGDGSIDAVTPADSTSSGAKSDAKSVPPKFLKTVLKAVQAWRFDPEIVDGTPISGKGRVPIVFCMDGTCPDSDNSGTKAPEPQFTALDPAVGLRTAVAGTAL